jgi:hypothetical protein
VLNFTCIVDGAKIVNFSLILVSLFKLIIGQYYLLFVLSYPKDILEARATNDLSGRHLNSLQKGINIVKTANGVQKVLNN